VVYSSTQAVSLVEPSSVEQKPLKAFKGKWTAAFIIAAVLGTGGGALAGLGPGPLREETPKVFFVAGIADEPPTPVLRSGADDGQPVTAEAVSAAISTALADPRLGPNALAAVADLETGQKLYDKAADTAATPASTLKIATSAAALAARGAEYRIATRAVAGGQPGEVVIIGGGDPTLSVDGNGSYHGAAKLSDLAAQVKQALGGQAPTRVIVDGTLFTGPTAGPGWLPEDLVDGYAANITALSTDGARVNPKELKNTPRYHDPAMAAGVQFAKLLGLPESAVTGGRAEAGAREYGKVLSLPMNRLVEEALTSSDNMIAEALARQVALARGKPASFAGACEAIGEVLAGLGVTPPAVQVDGSGLSALNKVSPKFLTSLLTRAAKSDRPELRTLFTGLAVAGYTGTLEDRYSSSSDGAGIIRAKTGSLNGVDTLAGVVTTKSGRALVFAVMANGSPGGAREALDKVAILLARLK
jgi:D-alanyl-D-alanine carboxypeptidase/D-alanyl-D-alanine-endopeptidase (penicillin-binding protein 4)